MAKACPNFLRRQTLFGNEIVFCAPIRMLPFSESPVIGDLIDRVDKARLNR